MALTLWMNVVNGQRLDEDELTELRAKAHRAYEANRHIFEDEAEALGAYGVMPLLEAIRRDLVNPSLFCSLFRPAA